ncbi:hypothetical protein V1227_30085 [Lentzea sp. DG1S-22]|uniref:hypothetical protein n=1 Tax=Lentzea sp. DG1S-22 TaxID=3108822 RepID=UPI002E78EF10|nr:hypothetical protein [Lentzea sp. DG1S-22]WVH79258.1 hypothetical protein V1227_30085 [Lentzea sp. DG1S-22]
MRPARHAASAPLLSDLRAWASHPSARVRTGPRNRCAATASSFPAASMNSGSEPPSARAGPGSPSRNAHRALSTASSGTCRLHRRSSSSAGASTRRASAVSPAARSASARSTSASGLLAESSPAFAASSYRRSASGRSPASIATNPLLCRHIAARPGSPMASSTACAAAKSASALASCVALHRAIPRPISALASQRSSPYRRSSLTTAVSSATASRGSAVWQRCSPRRHRALASSPPRRWGVARSRCRRLCPRRPRSRSIHASARWNRASPVSRSPRRANRAATSR